VTELNHAVGTTVTAVTVSENGDLEVRLSGGFTVSVAAHPSFEAWSLTLSDGTLLVCTPGGNVACWGPAS
jgi:Family of unknown function (DUF6188)